MKGTLRSRRQFDEVYDSGLKAVGRHLVAFALCAPGVGTGDQQEVGDSRGVAVGIVASRKVGKAVDRNRAKRVLRASFTTLRPRVRPATRVVLVARRALVDDGVRSTELEAELEGLLSTLGVLTEDSR